MANIKRVINLRTSSSIKAIPCMEVMRMGLEKSTLHGHAKTLCESKESMTICPGGVANGKRSKAFMPYVSRRLGELRVEIFIDDYIHFIAQVCTFLLKQHKRHLCSYR